MVQQKIRKAVIPVAGLGTRSLPVTKEVPKELLPIVDTPAIHFIVDELVQAGIETLIFVTSKGKTALEDYFDRAWELEETLRRRGKTQLADRIRDLGNWVEVISVRQKEPLGLGHAVLCAKSVVGDEPFVVCLGDEVFPLWEGNTPAVLSLVKAWSLELGAIVGVKEVEKELVNRYGIIQPGSSSEGRIQVVGVVEKPSSVAAPSNLALIRRYLFSPEIFECLSAVRPKAGAEIGLTEGIELLAKRKPVWATILAGLRYDMGSSLSYIEAQVHAGLREASTRKTLAEALRRLMAQFDC